MRTLSRRANADESDPDEHANCLCPRGILRMRQRRAVLGVETKANRTIRGAGRTTDGQKARVVDTIVNFCAAPTSPLFLLGQVGQNNRGDHKIAQMVDEFAVWHMSL